jgi:hypothetical protein
MIWDRDRLEGGKGYPILYHHQDVFFGSGDQLMFYPTSVP